ncbi:MAG: hypothetical protein AMS27_03205 [Bacteroides sp. SM23_62_1]|nr:MAG: hypothetical protein AMS27_03205 [Bacteroides sp. SM23_62_1]
MIYKFRLLSNEVEDFIRDFEVHSDQTFYDLHLAIQKNLHWDHSQIASFFFCNDNWEKELEITLFDLSDEPANQTLVMDGTKFSDHIKELKQKLLYVFDVFNERAFFIEVVEIRQGSPDKTYPSFTNSLGSPPVQIYMDHIFSVGDTSQEMGDLGFEISGDDSFIDNPGFDDIIFDDIEPDEE